MAPPLQALMARALFIHLPISQVTLLPPVSFVFKLSVGRNFWCQQRLPGVWTRKCPFPRGWPPGGLLWVEFPFGDFLVDHLSRQFLCRWPRGYCFPGTHQLLCLVFSDSRSPPWLLWVPFSFCTAFHHADLCFLRRTPHWHKAVVRSGCWLTVKLIGSLKVQATTGKVLKLKATSLGVWK